jgi:hypothetical protein
MRRRPLQWDNESESSSPRKEKKKHWESISANKNQLQKELRTSILDPFQERQVSTPLPIGLRSTIMFPWFPASRIKDREENSVLNNPNH